MDHDASRTAVVTGARRGIGAAITRSLHRDGHKVALLNRDAEVAAATAEAIDPAGTTASAVAADVAATVLLDHLCWWASALRAARRTRAYPV